MRTVRIVAWLALFAALSACPRITECSFRCETGSRCALGLTCGKDGYCHADKQLDHCAADGGSVDGLPPPSELNVVFVTSSTFVPGQAFAGLDGADTQCSNAAAAAAAAGKLPAGTYHAWLSTSVTDASTRLGTARGWIRPDGLPFADSLGSLLAGQIFYPARITELGVDLPGATVATGTRYDGTRAPNTAQDFTSSTAPFDSGSSSGTSGTWTDFADGSGAAHLYCFGVDHSHPLTIAPAAGRLAFLSATPFVPGGGLAAADLLCNQDAADNGLADGRSYRALLATATQPALSRFDPGKPWVRRDGVPWAGPAPTSLNVDAHGDYRGGFVWTGASAIDEPAASTAWTCLDWMSSAASAMAVVGEASKSDRTGFSSTSGFQCSLGGVRIYCLQN
jgi:hypothetical protein